ncbi:homoserine kinase [Halanaeroarchaeum sulfurireducens]|uniref:Homoserine kinase n=1 Tax=Halanaeroarchaeum sulfurireducens TaxID=1604004 RepID=A0A0N9N6N7_9EURY|nr:homoserine kinase [Halanaeroarchaeum sulfurireducens]ALG82730.1 homoserine kinase [Halanaeroarchaeum sulfurireducens]
MVTVRAPATSANLGSGFDVFGVAFDRPADVVTVERARETSIEVTGVGSEYIPNDPEKNTAGVVASALDAPASISIDKGVRPSSGLGSSAASAAATAVALNELYGRNLSDHELVQVAAEGEAAVSGTAQCDNVAPAILGGFTVVREDGVESVDASIPLVAVLPDIVISTRDARHVVPESITIEDMVRIVGSAATLTAGMYRDDPDLVGRGMEDDVVTPARADLIQGYDRAVEAAREAGATGATVSGAGPAILAVTHSGDQRDVAAAMLDAFEADGIDSRAFTSTIGSGATIF